MEVQLPYKYTIYQNSVLKLVTKPIPNNNFTWPTFVDGFGHTKLKRDFTIVIPGGITCLQVYVSKAPDSSPSAMCRIKNFDSKKYWFDNINTSGSNYPVIKVAPYQSYNLMLDEATDIKDGGFLQLRYSDEINKETPDIKDL